CNGDRRLARGLVHRRGFSPIDGSLQLRRIGRFPDAASSLAGDGLKNGGANDPFGSGPNLCRTASLSPPWGRTDTASISELLNARSSGPQHPGNCLPDDQCAGTAWIGT